MTFVRSFPRRAWLQEIAVADKLGTGANDPTVLSYLQDRDIKVATAASTAAGTAVNVDVSTEGTIVIKAPTGGTYADKSYTNVDRISRVLVTATPSQATDEADFTTVESGVRQIVSGREDYRFNLEVLNSDQAKGYANSATDKVYLLYVKELDARSTKKNILVVGTVMPGEWSEEDTGRSSFPFTLLNIGSKKPQWQADAA